ncbi:MATE family efflux transporter [Clostridium sp.]|uniref:MATE family efflux transporter n=1 Tax=Clostridium sp. TaxID=1506 RepID=UPI003F3305AF
MKSKVKNFFNDPKFFRTLFVLALPIILQNILTSSLNMADTLMVGSIGDAQVAAVGIGNQFSFLFNLIVIGTTGGCSIFISQYWGKKDKKNIKKVVGLGGVSVIIVAILAMLVALLAPEVIVSIFSKDEVVIKEASAYLSIVSLSYIVTAITFTFATALRCMEDAKTPMIISAIAIGINITLNYILIFGKFGMPALGVSGAAIATVIARFIECLLIVIRANKNKVLHGKVKEYISFDKSFVRIVYKSVIPVVLNEACWGLGTFFYSIAYGRLGTEAMASVQITNNIQNMFFVVCFSMASSSLVMIGNQIGAGKEEEAKRYGRKFTILSFMIGIILGILVSLLATSILGLFNVSEVVKEYSTIILRIYGVFYPIRVVNLVLIVGVFRGGGDAGFALKVEAFTMWLIGVPMAFIGAAILGLPIYLVILMVTAEEVVKFIASMIRLRSYKWVHNVIDKTAVV